MGKRILITSTDLMMIQFLAPHVQNLAEHGYKVEIACSDVGGRMDEVRDRLKDWTGAIHTVRLVRSPASLTNLKGYRDMKKVIDAGNYDIIWTNEPVMGVVTRLAARKARNFARADAIRDELLAKGIVLEDTREGVKWKRA